MGAAAYKADLVNTIELCNRVGNPHKKIRTIHVAGTNGKGSVSHMLASIFQHAGYRTGLYTSPHLKDFRERIRINGEMVDECSIMQFTEKIRPAIEEIEPSFFEITVAMAFEFFATKNVDIAIIETGLGGRLDSTNVITPELSVITNIGMDHMNLLGDSIEKIALEKAGIIKHNVPVVIGEANEITEPIFHKVANEKKSTLKLAYKKYQALNWKWEHNMLVVEVAQKDKIDHQIYQLDLAGVYQVKNLVTVLAAIDVLQHDQWKITERDIHEALKNVKKTTGLHGRWEVIHQHPLVVLDVAHNEDGIRQLLQQIELTDHHELKIVMGMVKDKEIDRILNLLPLTAHYYFTQANIPRALDVETLFQSARDRGLRGKPIKDVKEALQLAKSEAKDGDLIVVCGSVFVVAETL